MDPDQVIRDWLDENPATRISAVALARNLKISRPTLYRYIEKIRLDDSVTLPPVALPPPPDPLPPPSAPEPSDTMLSNIEHLTEDERLQMLSEMARTASDNVRIKAIQVIEELTRSRGGTVGPPGPTDRADMVRRLTRLLVAAGRDVSKEALDNASKLWGVT